MALTVTARGTGTHNVSSTTFTLSPSGTLAAGSLAVLVVAADNAAASGVAFTTFAVSDNNGNVWTRRVTPLYDPGAASEGVTGAQFTTDMAGGVLTTSTVITVRFDTATTAKAWVLWEVIPATMKVVSYIASGVNTGSATTTPTVTTSSITSGDVVIGGLHNEYGTAQTVTADADTTNGTWSAQQTTEIGTTAAGMSVASQAKVVSGTATQTYNPTLGTSSDVILSWMQLREIPFLKVGAVDQTAYALLDSMRLSLNTFDFALKDPATIPALGDAVTVGLPVWSGTVASVTTTDATLTYGIVTVTATNEDEAFASAAPFGLSDAPGTGFAAAVIATAPAGYWRLGESSGTVAADEMGANVGTYVNTPTLGATSLLTGDANTAVTFNGTNENITVADSAMLNCFEGTAAWTFASWVSHTPDATYRRIMEITDGVSEWVTLASQNTLLYASRHNGAGGDDLTATPLAAGTHLVVATYNGSAMALYVDGALTTGGTNPLASTRSLGAFTSSLCIGVSAFGGSYFNGTLDEPALWNRALSAAEVAALYAAAPFAPGVTYAYRDMAVRTTTNLDASVETTGSCTIQRAGLWPAMTFELTSANRGYAAESFSVTNTTVTWPLLTSPVFRIEFGDPIVTMSVWVASQTALPGPGTITQTMITDGAVTTPKLAANSVTAAKLQIGSSGGVPLTNPDFEMNTLDGWTTSTPGTSTISTGSIVTTWIGQGLYGAVIYGGSAGNNPYMYQACGSVAPGEYVLVSALLASDTGAATRVHVEWLDNAAASIAFEYENLAAHGGPLARASHVYGPAPATSATFRVYFQQVNAGVYSVIDDIQVSRQTDVVNANGNVAIDSSGITVIEGAITVTNAGATVIIDGTSNMFKIAASGSVSKASNSGDDNVYTDTTLTGLGALATIPAHLAFIALGNATTDQRSSGTSISFGTDWVAITSGGAVTAERAIPVMASKINLFLDGSSQCVIRQYVINGAGGSQTHYGKYYVLVEAAL